MSTRVTPLSAAETAGVVADVVAPLFARGVIVRRPRVVGALDRVDADRRAIRRLQRIRADHGTGPALLRIPGRRFAVVLDPADARRVLDETPVPFAAATREKRAALGHFQPHGVLITQDLAERADRRRFNEAVLRPGRPSHPCADRFTAVLDEELAPVLAARELDWDTWAPAFWRIVRRVVLGDGARDDETLTDLLTRLRGDANWAFLKPRRRGVRSAFFDRLHGHLDRAEPGSLAALVASAPSTAATRPDHQVPQWLFAFDAAGMATFRALALLQAHPGTPDDAATLRGTMLESVRLWPTTPAILRDTTAETSWSNGSLPAGTGLVVFAPFLHRDAERLPYADRFAPELWRDGRGDADAPLVPFSRGPGECPGRDVVLLLTTAALERLRAAGFGGAGAPALDASAPLPATLSPFRLRFAR